MPALYSDAGNLPALNTTSILSCMNRPWVCRALDDLMSSDMATWASGEVCVALNLCHTHSPPQSETRGMSSRGLEMFLCCWIEIDMIYYFMSISLLSLWTILLGPFQRATKTLYTALNKEPGTLSFTIDESSTFRAGKLDTLAYKTENVHFGNTNRSLQQLLTFQDFDHSNLF